MAEMNSKKPFRDDWGTYIRPWHEKAIHIIETYLSKITNETVINFLNIGVGKGLVRVFISEYLKRRFQNLEIVVMGIGYVNNLENYCKDKVVFNIVDLNNQSLPFPDNYFHIITAFEVIEHLWVPENLVKECYRVLKPGGLFLLSFPNLRWLRNIFLLILGYQPYNVGTGYFSEYGTLTKIDTPSYHVKAYTPRAILEMFGKTQNLE